MSNQLQEFFVTTSTCGFKKETGSWAIDIGLPKELSPTSLNNLTYKMLDVFLTAFHSLCKPTEVHYDTISFDANDKVREVKEGQIIQIRDRNLNQLFLELQEVINSSDRVYFTDIFLYCDLKTFVPGRQDCLKQVWIPNSARFHIGYVLEPNDKGGLFPIDGSISFDTDIDVWVEKTLNMQSYSWCDNKACAEKNQPLLVQSLKRWENLVNKPIIEWSSRLYSEQIYKYGFQIGSAM